MRKKVIGIALSAMHSAVCFIGALLFALCLPVAAQQQKVPGIGLLFAGDPSAVMGRIKVFRQGLHERGYVEGKNIVIEYRYGEGKFSIACLLSQPNWCMSERRQGRLTFPWNNR